MPLILMLRFVARKKVIHDWVPGIKKPPEEGFLLMKDSQYEF